MTLSADIQNHRSPYKLSQLGEFTFRFVTDQNIHYTVGFYKDTIFKDVHIILFHRNRRRSVERCTRDSTTSKCHSPYARTTLIALCSTFRSPSQRDNSTK